MKKVFAGDRDAWRKWLSTNFNTVNEIWLVYYKKGSGKSSVDYEASVQEALCFGWIDSVIKAIDEETYARKFTPRKETSNWSSSNKKRAALMIEQGRMTEHGLRLVDAAKQNGQWDAPDSRPQIPSKPSIEFSQALNQNKQAKETFDNLSPSHQKQYLGWIETAKREETKAKRIAEAIQMLEKRMQLGLK
ncbi:MAG: YdeI/OmpD-associated family protein [Anaerolineae bacterium]|nr:YdeI/OmpD-associated family protein [Anaerolineae bacterium]